jgi:hypothetical protein
MAACLEGEETAKVTQTGPVTMTPPVKRGPHSGSRTALRDAVRRAWPARVLNSTRMRDGSRRRAGALAGRR